jgi:hypothetical protein
MPRLVDYAARVEFLRRAAFAIVRDRGVGDLSRHAIARELGTSVSTVCRILNPDAQLTTLAVDELNRRRRIGRWSVPSGSPGQVALALLRRVLPDEDHRIAEELVWWRLVIASAAGKPFGDDTRSTHDTDWGEGNLRDQFQVATRGYADDTTHGDPDVPAEETATDQVARQFEEHDASVNGLLRRVLVLLEVPEPHDAEAVRLKALLDGLSLGVCLGRLRPAEAVAALAHHMSTVRVAA